MRGLFLPAAVAALVSFAPAVSALEPFKVYDRFADAPLDAARWAEGERVREVKKGRLQLMQRSYGLAASDVGVQSQNWNTSLTNPATVTSLRARINVVALETQACPTNPALSQARARIVGTFFNTGTPTPGSQVGDALAQIRLTRFSNSADAAGVLRVQGFLSICSSADCAQSGVVGNIVDLGTVAVGTPAVVQMQWDRGGKTFYFTRDNGAAAGAVAYTFDDSSAPSAAFKQLSTRVDLPNCTAGPVSAVVDARFDDVRVNQGATP
jgi:hypothetical protein